MAPGPRLVLSTPNTVTNLHVAAPSGPEAAECLVCSELALLVLFMPCQHRTVCEGECARWFREGAERGGANKPNLGLTPRRVRAQNEEVHQVPGGHQQEAAPRWVGREGQGAGSAGPPASGPPLTWTLP